MSEVDADAALEALVARLQGRGGVIMLLGAIDTGKTSLAARLLGAALDDGRSPIYVDTDLGQSTTGPPGTIGWRRAAGRSELDDLFEPDGLYFVGDVTPARQLLPTLTGTALAVQAARDVSDSVVVDTSGFVAGVVAQALKLHKVELIRPDHVIGLQQGEELEPLLGVIRRFSPAEVTRLPVHPAVVPKGAEERAERRRQLLARYFGGELTRYLVRPAAFMPTLPPTLDLSMLHGMLAGLEDGRGATLGLGVVEHHDDALRLAARPGIAPSALRLGSIAVDEDWITRSVNLRALLGSA